MKNVPAVAAVVLAACLAAAAAVAKGAHSRRGAEKGCSPSAAMMAVADRDRNLVRLTPTQSSIGDLSRLPAPRTAPRRRSTTFQRRTWRVVAMIAKVGIGPKGEIRLILWDNDSYMTASIPTRLCGLTRPAVRRAVSIVRSQFVTSCGRPHGSGEPLGAIAYVTGVGYWGPSGAGRAKNGASLYPVTGITRVAGCGA